MMNSMHISQASMCTVLLNMRWQHWYWNSPLLMKLWKITWMHAMKLSFRILQCWMMSFNFVPCRTLPNLLERSLEETSSCGSTEKLWVQYFKPVGIMRHFVRAKLEAPHVQCTTHDTVPAYSYAAALCKINSDLPPTNAGEIHKIWLFHSAKNWQMLVRNLDRYDNKTGPHEFLKNNWWFDSSSWYFALYYSKMDPFVSCNI